MARGDAHRAAVEPEQAVPFHFGTPSKPGGQVPVFRRGMPPAEPGSPAAKQKDVPDQQQPPFAFSFKQQKSERGPFGLHADATFGLHASPGAKADSPSFFVAPPPAAEPFKFRSPTPETRFASQGQAADAQSLPKERLGGAIEADPGQSLAPVAGADGKEGAASTKGGSFNLGASTPSAKPWRAHRHNRMAAGEGRPRRVAGPHQAPSPAASQAGRVRLGDSPPGAVPFASSGPFPAPGDEAQRLRQRGNDAFAKGSYARAADLYQRVRQI